MKTMKHMRSCNASPYRTANASPYHTEMQMKAANTLGQFTPSRSVKCLFYYIQRAQLCTFSDPHCLSLSSDAFLGLRVPHAESHAISDQWGAAVSDQRLCNTLSAVLSNLGQSKVKCGRACLHKRAAEQLKLRVVRHHRRGGPQR